MANEYAAPMNMLHIYAQELWHDECFILGTPDDLARLAEQLRIASINGESKGEYFTGDGEGYSVIVKAEDSKTLEQLRMPYTDEMAKDGGNSPSYLVVHLMSPDTPEDAAE